MERIIKVTLAVLFFLCLADMPYGYYQLVRFLALAGFAFLTYQAYLRGNQNEMFLYGALALLFQPIFKIALGRMMWNIVDVIVGTGLILSVLYENFRVKNE